MCVHFVSDEEKCQHPFPFILPKYLSSLETRVGAILYAYAHTKSRVDRPKIRKGEGEASSFRREPFYAIPIICVSSIIIGQAIHASMYTVHFRSLLSRLPQLKLCR